jgi:hypothetical protein
MRPVLILRDFGNPPSREMDCRASMHGIIPLLLQKNQPFGVDLLEFAQHTISCKGGNS